MCDNMKCLDCPSFDGTCKSLQAYILKVLYLKILFRRMKYTSKRKIHSIKVEGMIKLYNFNVEISTLLYNLKVTLKTIKNNHKTKKKIKFIDQILSNKTSF